MTSTKFDSPVGYVYRSHRFGTTSQGGEAKTAGIRKDVQYVLAVGKTPNELAFFSLVQEETRFLSFDIRFVRDAVLGKRYEFRFVAIDRPKRVRQTFFPARWSRGTLNDAFDARKRFHAGYDRIP